MADLPRHPASAPNPGRPAHGPDARARPPASMPNAVLPAPLRSAVRRTVRWREGASALPRYWAARLTERLWSQLARGRSTDPKRPEGPLMVGRGVGAPGEDEVGSVVLKTTAVRGLADEETSPEPERCSFIRDFAPDGEVLREEEIQRLSRHAAQCLQCMEHFIALVRGTTTRPSGT